jgi:hypothetical protein
MTKRDIAEHAREQSTKVVNQLRQENADKPAAKYVTDKDYERLQRLLARKIVSYSS